MSPQAIRDTPSTAPTPGSLVQSELEQFVAVQETKGRSAVATVEQHCTRQGKLLLTVTAAAAALLLYMIFIPFVFVPVI